MNRRNFLSTACASLVALFAKPKPRVWRSLRDVPDKVVVRSTPIGWVFERDVSDILPGTAIRSSWWSSGETYGVGGMCPFAFRKAFVPHLLSQLDREAIV